MKKQELTSKEMFSEIVKMIEVKPELFQVFEDLCQKSIHELKQK